MANGKKPPSPLLRALQQTRPLTTAEIRVFLTQRWFERDPFDRARTLFMRHGMWRSSGRNGVLLYVNLRRRKFAIIADRGFHEAVGEGYWKDFRDALAQDLRSTHWENALALAVQTLGVTLAGHYPRD